MFIVNVKIGCKRYSLMNTASLSVRAHAPHQCHARETSRAQMSTSARLL